MLEAGREIRNTQGGAGLVGQLGDQDRGVAKRILVAAGQSFDLHIEQTVARGVAQQIA
ncbi:MAG: hypothetical protein ACREWE_04690 [Gammaproteobacteria bacterium]